MARKPSPGPRAAYDARCAAGEIEFDPAQAALADRLDAFTAALARWCPEAWFGGGAAPRGLYLWGGVGRGKSMLMDLFFEAAPVERKWRVHFHEFMLTRHAFMKAARARAETGQDQLIEACAKDVAARARLLCFDELQVTDIADAMILGRLFERLFELDVVVVATSNRPPRDLYKNGLNRQLFLPFIDLIDARLEVVELPAARDYRLQRLMAEPVYFAPLVPFAAEAMDRAWARLTMGAAPRALDLDVAGRTLHVARAAASCARFTFAELCERPLGSADYLQIAERFDAVLLENVPRLGPERREEAARFRNLIDALYEAKVKLICSADSEPQTLYPAGEQSFEFERTASRLMEMRSKDYLAAERRDAEWRRGLVAG
jgi:cell division protein ZapE